MNCEVCNKPYASSLTIWGVVKVFLCTDCGPKVRIEVDKISIDEFDRLGYKLGNIRAALRGGIKNGRLWLEHANNIADDRVGEAQRLRTQVQKIIEELKKAATSKAIGERDASAQ